jgi:phage tail protein X
MQVVARQGDTIDALCWRHLRATRAVVEQVLLMNPGIADLGPILPQGTAVALPDPQGAAIVPTLNLWD